MAAIESYVALVLFFFGGVVAVLFRFCSPCQVAPSQSAGMKKLQQLKEILVEEGRERVTSRRPAKRYARSLQSGAVVGGHADWTDICGGWTTIRRIGAPAQPIGWARRGGLCWILI